MEACCDLISVFVYLSVCLIVETTVQIFMKIGKKELTTFWKSPASGLRIYGLRIWTGFALAQYECSRSA